MNRSVRVASSQYDQQMNRSVRVASGNCCNLHSLLNPIHLHWLSDHFVIIRQLLLGGKLHENFTNQSLRWVGVISDSRKMLVELELQRVFLNSNKT